MHGGVLDLSDSFASPVAWAWRQTRSRAGARRFHVAAFAVELSSRVVLTLTPSLMTEPCRRDDLACHSRPPCGGIDDHLLARAAQINETVAAEFAEAARSPHDNPLLERLA